MNANLNETPSANRVHIGIFGKRNSGKSSLINAISGQEVSIVSDTLGTTTDPVFKPMEIAGIGPCVLIDTAGFDDSGKLGDIRVEKTKKILDKIDIAVFVFEKEMIHKSLKEETLDENSLKEYYSKEFDWIRLCKEKNIKVLNVLNKVDYLSHNEVDGISGFINKETHSDIITFSCKNKDGLDKLMNALLRCVPQDFDNVFITRDFVNEDDNVLLVMPQDIQAPKGRLILPQVQTIRELLDKKCLVTCVTTDKVAKALDNMKVMPKLIICDSQVFDEVYKLKPKESLLTSFSILFSAYKGDFEYYLKSVDVVDTFNDNSKVLIAECCTHAPMHEDIGRVKIPRLLRKKYGEKLECDVVSGTDFPDDLTKYDLVVQCGGCMFNRKYVMSRIDKAKTQNIPMTNYGVLIAKLTGNKLNSIIKQ